MSARRNGVIPFSLGDLVSSLQKKRTGGRGKGKRFFWGKKGGLRNKTSERGVAIGKGIAHSAAAGAGWNFSGGEDIY